MSSVRGDVGARSANGSVRAARNSGSRDLASRRNVKSRREDIEYQAVLGRGWLSPWVEGGKFCGSRGMALPLLGMRIRLKGSAAASYDCSYAATFVDGTTIGPVAAGEACEAESLAGLEAFQVVLRRRDGARCRQTGRVLWRPAIPWRAPAGGRFARKAAGAQCSKSACLEVPVRSPELSRTIPSYRPPAGCVPRQRRGVHHGAEREPLAGVRKIPYARPLPSHIETHPIARDLDAAGRRAAAVGETSAKLKALGFEPDIIIGHHGWGELLNLRDVWPDVPLLGYMEFFYRIDGYDVGFDPEFPTGLVEHPRIRAKNAVNLIALELGGHGQTPDKMAALQLSGLGAAADHAAAGGR